ncbi:unnamed protein product [Pylaiella littoralis]
MRQASVCAVSRVWKGTLGAHRDRGPVGTEWYRLSLTIVKGLALMIARGRRHAHSVYHFYVTTNTFQTGREATRNEEHLSSHACRGNQCYFRTALKGCVCSDFRTL